MDPFEKYQKAASIALAQNNANAESMPEPPFVPAVQGKFETLGMLLKDATGDLVMLSDRVLGPFPRSVPESGQANTRAGAAYETLDMLDRLIGMATAVRDEAQRLNGRI